MRPETKLLLSLSGIVAVLLFAVTALADLQASVDRAEIEAASQYRPAENQEALK